MKVSPPTLFTAASVIAAAASSAVMSEDSPAQDHVQVNGSTISIVSNSDNNSHLNNMSNSNMTGSDINSSVMQGLTYNRWQTNNTIYAIIVPIVFGIIFIVGLVGNGTLIVTVIANKVMRNVPNILIVSLSLGDFLLILVSVPFTSVIYTFFNWPFGNVVCKVNEYMQTLSLGVSVFTLTALSADRYVAIVDPMAKLTGRTQRTAVAIAAGIWIFSALIALPDAIFYAEREVIGFDNNNLHTYCMATPPDGNSMYPEVSAVVKLIVYFILPNCTIGVFYMLMARMLIRSGESVPTESKTGAANHQRQIAARKKVARVVLSFVVIFIVCWLPRHIFLMWFHYGHGSFNEFWFAFKTAGFCLKFLNSCVNPFALYFLSGQFRKYYNRYLFCCCRGVRYSSLDQTSTMHSLHSTNKRASPTNTSMVHSQSMC